MVHLVRHVRRLVSALALTALATGTIPAAAAKSLDELRQQYAESLERIEQASAGEADPLEQARRVLQLADSYDKRLAAHAQAAVQEKRLGDAAGFRTERELLRSRTEVTGAQDVLKADLARQDAERKAKADAQSTALRAQRARPSSPRPKEPDSEEFDDGRNDFLRGESHPPYLDLRRIALTRRGPRDLSIRVEVDEDIPDQVAQYSKYNVCFDLNRDGKTGQDVWQRSDDVTVCFVRDPRLNAWTADIEKGGAGARPEGFAVGACRVRGPQVTATLHADDPTAFDRFNFVAYAYVFPVKVVDLAPDSTFFSFTSHASE